MAGHSIPQVAHEGFVQISFGHLSEGKKHYVKFVHKEGHNFQLLLYKKSAAVLSKEVSFTAEEVCGLDWGTIDRSRRFAFISFPSEMLLFLTLIIKSRTISFLFSERENEMMKKWKAVLKKHLNLDIIRETGMNYGQYPALLHVNVATISLTTKQEGMRPSTCMEMWKIEHYYGCEVRQPEIRLMFIGPNKEKQECILMCTRGDEILTGIRSALASFTITEMFSNSQTYAEIEDFLHLDARSDYFDLNKVGDLYAEKIGNRSLSRQLEKIYKKLKDIQISNKDIRTVYNLPNDVLNDTEKYAAHLGAIISKMREVAPQPNTLGLSEELRADICARLYSTTATGRISDWTALASVIGEGHLL